MEYFLENPTIKRIARRVYSYFLKTDNTDHLKIKVYLAELFKLYYDAHFYDDELDKYYEEIQSFLNSDEIKLYIELTNFDCTEGYDETVEYYGRPFIRLIAGL